MALRALPSSDPELPVGPTSEALVESYRRLAEVFHLVLSEHDRDALLERLADTLADLVPYEELHLYEADEDAREFVPVLARSLDYQEEIMQSRPAFGMGLTGWAVQHRAPVWTNEAHLDPRASVIPGTPVEPEALIVIPLVARGTLMGALNIYRLGADATFQAHEFELAKWFGDAAALALDNAQVRARLEYLAQTDSLTGLYNHRYFHERLRAELTRASRSRDSVAILMFDLDDFKRVNDVYGHSSGDQLLGYIARIARDTVRASDVVCRIGGEEFGVIMPSCDAGDALGLATRLMDRLRSAPVEPSGIATLSMGVSQGPIHAMNPRELVACAEAAMMTAKARGKNQVVVYDPAAVERPASALTSRDVRSLAHMKLLQSLAGKLNRLNDVRRIAETIANELRLLIDYHSCRVYLREGERLLPIAIEGSPDGADRVPGPEAFETVVGEGITGRVAELGESLLVPNAAECEFGVPIPGTDDIEESIAAVPLRYGARVCGVIVISKLGVDQFDEDDVRLLEVLAGQASVALENARLYEQQRREAEGAKALLDATRELAEAESPDDVRRRAVTLVAQSLGALRAAIWVQPDAADERLVALTSTGYGTREPSEWRYLPFDLARSHPDIGIPDVLEGDAIPKAERVPGQDAVFALVPFRLEGDRAGLITATLMGREPEARRVELLAGLARQVTLALGNAEHYARLERTFLATVTALVNALETNGPRSTSSARWIADASLCVGRELGLDRETLKRLELSALFHDIGEIGIPAGILAKPGPLSPDERAVVEKHPLRGEGILAPIERLADVRPVVRGCHERWDGFGYPDGSAGEAIPREARIIAVCDAFHAMVTDRPYRERLAPGEALAQLWDGSGTQFDPSVVEMFLRLYDRGDLPLVAPQPV